MWERAVSDTLCVFLLVFTSLRHAAADTGSERKVWGLGTKLLPFPLTKLENMKNIQKTLQK